MQSADCILSPMQSADCAGSQIACNIYIRAETIIPITRISLGKSEIDNRQALSIVHNNVSSAGIFPFCTQSLMCRRFVRSPRSPRTCEACAHIDQLTRRAPCASAVKADSQYQKCSDQRPTTAPRPVAVLSQGVAVEHGSTSATGDRVAGPVSIEM